MGGVGNRATAVRCVPEVTAVVEGLGASGVELSIVPGVSARPWPGAVHRWHPRWPLPWRCAAVPQLRVAGPHGIDALTVVVARRWP